MSNIRAMTRSDYAAVAQINARSRPHVAPLDENELERLFALSNNHLVAISRENDVLAYVLAFDQESPYDGEEFHLLRQIIGQPLVYIDQVAIQETERGRGLGRELYNFLEAHALAGGIEWLCCEVNTQPPNPGSSVFHRKLGFQELGKLDTLDGRTVELLAKRIAK